MRTSSRGGLPKTFGRKSQQWEAELQLLAAETTRLEAPKPPVAVTTEKTLELAKQGRKSLQIAGFDGTAQTAGNCAIELFV